MCAEDESCELVHHASCMVHMTNRIRAREGLEGVVVDRGKECMCGYVSMLGSVRSDASVFRGLSCGPKGPMGMLVAV